MKILVVCLGNICRSPLAEGILLHMATQKKLEVTIDSAGTSNYHIDEAPDHRTIANAKKHNVDLTELRARQFTAEDFDAFDKIYVMDKSNLRNVLNLARNKEDEKKVDLFLNISHPGQNMEVPDPYFGGEEGFEKVFQMIWKASEKLLSDL